MKKVIFEGSGVAIITPFNDTGIDYRKMEELIEFQVKHGTDAIIVCGTTGEASTMTDIEQLEVIKFVVSKVNKRIPVIAGTGSNNTYHAIELSKKAEEIGVDALLCVTPYYNKTTQKGLYEHFKLIATSVKIPIILYNVPSRTGLNIDVSTLNSLCEIENIVAIKECNLNQMGATIHLLGDKITVYTGNDDQVLPALSFGAKGVISVMANIIPRETHELVHKFLQGDLESSRQIQLRVLELVNALFIEVNPIPIKDAMNLMGMNVGNCRLPLVNMSEKNLEVLKTAMKNYGLIN